MQLVYKKLATLLMLIVFGYTAWAQNQISISGKVISINNQPISGVSLAIKESAIVSQTDIMGSFNLKVNLPATLILSCMGYESKQIDLTKKSQLPLLIELSESNNALQEVTVSTGYQKIPKERATGSFAQLDNKDFNRRVGADVLSRLDGTVSGLTFNNSSTNTTDISIRGMSTIFSNTQPLIVVDNFPYDGDMRNLNPNDVESVTVLKDAAAASIWGARAGNGVIVITTKKGTVNRLIKVSFTGNFTLGERPDLFYNPNFLNAADYINVERFLYDKKFYTSSINNTRSNPVLSPVVELLIKQAANPADASIEQEIKNLSKYDYRTDMEKYFYRKSAAQQYAVSLSGGNEGSQYYFSLGYDQNVSNLVRNSNSRFSMKTSYSFKPAKNLEIQTAINFGNSKLINNNLGFGLNPSLNAISSSVNKNLYPYARLADENGSPLAIAKDFRYSWVTAPEQGQLLDWQYRPLEELKLADQSTKAQEILVNLGANYQISEDFTAEIKYQLEQAVNNDRNYQSIDSYAARSIINRYSVVTNGLVKRNLPYGGILNEAGSHIRGNILRTQLNYNKQIAADHQLTALAGAEVKELLTSGQKSTLYGYDEEHATTSKIDYKTLFPLYMPTGATLAIPFNDSRGEFANRYISYYANTAYTYLNRYTLSASARNDASNLFGVKTNQQSVPLWSTGLSWNISREPFYTIKFLPDLKLRATYGYSGNVDQTTTAYLTARYSNNPLTGVQDATITNPENPDLKWERIRQFNIGLDFTSANSIISGSIEYYHKKGFDLIADAALPPSSGVTTFRGNVANTIGHGFDFILNNQVKIGQFNWLNSILFSYVTDKVTSYNVKPNISYLIAFGDGRKTTYIFPVSGRPVYSFYSYRYAGLDKNGNPQGYLNGQVSNDYSAITGNTPIEELIYGGPARPTWFGTYRPTIQYKQFSLSASFLFKLGYYFRKSALDYDALFNYWTGNKDFSLRWQHAGDENHTSVPAMVYPNIPNRDFYYQYNDGLVLKADNIRLQDLQFNYSLPLSKNSKGPFKQFQVYVYCNNLGILWRANKENLDPDVLVMPNPKTYSLGVKAEF